MKTLKFTLLSILIGTNYNLQAQTLNPDGDALRAEILNANTVTNIDGTFKLNQGINNRNNNANTYQNIGSFRVTGNQYYKNIALNGKAFKAGKLLSHDKIMYDTYLQQLIFKTPADNGLMYDVTIVDSFTISKNEEEKILDDMHFINGLLIDGKQKGFYQLMATNGKQTVYKAIKTTVEMPTDSYAKKDFREFVEATTFYFTDNTTSKTEFKKIKLTKNWLKTNFITHTAAINYLENTSIDNNADVFIKTFFRLL